MRRFLPVLILLGTIFSSACAPTTVSPTSTSEPLLITPVEDIIASYTVTFDTPDGATLTGELYGSGDTAVIFSVMGNCKPGWREFAQLTTAQGLMALTYQWRGCTEFGPTSDAALKPFVDDLRGAIDFMREQGAEKIILAGASLGGCASAKLAVELQADGLIVVASPPEISQLDFAVDATDVNSDIPKLFITAENDNIVLAVISRQLYDLAADPKEWQTYPGTAHGTDLFDTEYGEEMQQRILEFILAIAKR